MVTLHGYQPPKRTLWQGRRDGGGVLRVHEAIQCINVHAGLALAPRSVVLIGFCCDEGIRRNSGRPGAKEGPDAWRKALADMPLPEYFQRPLIDVGDITCPDGNLENAQKALGELVALVLTNHAFPIVCGGGHEVAWGQFQGISQVGRADNLAIVNFDAHYDLRPLLSGNLGSSGTSFTQIAADQKQHGKPFYYACIGLQPLSNTAALHLKARECEALVIDAEDINHAFEELQHLLEMTENHYLTICMDVFAAPYAPGVSAPQPLGITPHEFVPILRHLASDEKLIACNFAELSPVLDRDGLTARLVAALTLELISHLPN